MARYYVVHTNILEAILEALRLSVETEYSHTIYSPVEPPHELFLVGATADANDMVQVGTTPLFSMQAHPGQGRCWPDLEAEAEEDMAP